MVVDDFDKAAQGLTERQENSRALLDVLANSMPNVTVKASLDIIAKGIDPDMRCKNGDTLLIHAAFIGETEIICALLEQGANPNLANSRKETPLHYAAFKVLPAAAMALLKHGADINARDEFGKTAEASAQGARFYPGGPTPEEKDHVLNILRNAAHLREEIQNFTTTGCATSATVKPMKRLQIKTPGSET